MASRRELPVHKRPDQAAGRCVDADTNVPGGRNREGELRLGPKRVRTRRGQPRLVACETVLSLVRPRGGTTRQDRVVQVRRRDLLEKPVDTAEAAALLRVVVDLVALVLVVLGLVVLRVADGALCALDGAPITVDADKPASAGEP